MQTGYTLALDMTARNIQDDAKKKGQPWSVAKVCNKWMGALIERNCRSHISLTHSLRHTHTHTHTHTHSLTHTHSFTHTQTNKGYDTFCPVSGFIDKSKLATPDNLKYAEILVFVHFLYAHTVIGV